MSRPPERLIDRLFAASAWLAAGLVVGVFAIIVGDLLLTGLPELNLSYLTGSPEDAGRAGGILPILVSTLLIVGISVLVALPLGLGAAIWLSEAAGPRFGPWARRSIAALAGMPSILFGLFGSAFFCKALGLGSSILAGGLTLACMALPIVIHATEAGLSSAPRELRLGAAALGLSRVATLWHLLLPAASHGLTVGLVLGIGRALAETAALIFTSGYVSRMPESVMDSGRALSLHIYDLAMNIPGGTPRATAAALVLLLLLLLLNGCASWLSARWLGEGLRP